MNRPDSTTRRGCVIDNGEVSPTLDTTCYVGVLQVMQLYGTDVEENPQAGRVFGVNGLSPCLDSCTGGNHMPKILVDNKLIRIRRLTPRECFRLQGFPDDYFDKAAFVNSDSQLYKQAGNSVTIDVIEAIAINLGKEHQPNGTT